MSYQRSHARSEQAIADIAAELARRPMTHGDLVTQLLLSECRIGVYLRQMKKAKMIHIAGWRAPERTGHHAKVWALGNRKDAPKPPKRPKAELDKARRERNRAAAIKAQNAPNLAPARKLAKFGPFATLFQEAA